MLPVRLNHIFPRYLINDTIFGKKLPNVKCVLLFCLQLLSQTVLILRKIERDIIIVRTRSFEVPEYALSLSGFN